MQEQLEITPEMLQQNPLLLVLLLVFAGGFLTLLAGSIASWVFVLYRVYRGLPLLVVTPWTPRVWGLADLVLLLMLVLACQFTAVFLGSAFWGIQFTEAVDEAIPLELAALVGVGYLIVVAMTAVWLIVRYHTNLEHVGVSPRGGRGYLKLGVIAGLFILPVIYAANLIVSIGFEAPYDHPLFTAMEEEGSFQNYLMACIAAVIAAPIAEEFLFRGILQGWLQSIPFSSPLAILLGASQSQRSDPYNAPFYHESSSEIIEAEIVDTRHIVQGGPSGLSSDNTESFSVDPSSVELAAASKTASLDSESSHRIAAGPTAESLKLNNPFAPGTSHLEYRPQTAGQLCVPAIWPSIVAGTLFGLAHWGYGLSFLPLSFLGIYLGLLYRATHSIWPGVVVHFMLNFTSMAALGITVLIRNATG